MADDGRRTPEQTKYEEAGRNYRFFATWRQLVWLANLAALGGVLKLSITAVKDAPDIAWYIPLIASPFPIILWMADLRTRRLTLYAVDAGADIEEKAGFFKTHRDKDKEHYMWRGGNGPLKIACKMIRYPIRAALTHAFAATAFFFGSSAALICLAYELYNRP